MVYWVTAFNHECGQKPKYFSRYVRLCMCPLSVFEDMDKVLLLCFELQNLIGISHGKDFEEQGRAECNLWPFQQFSYESVINGQQNLPSQPWQGWVLAWCSIWCHGHRTAGPVQWMWGIKRPEIQQDNNLKLSLTLQRLLVWTEKQTITMPYAICWKLNSISLLELTRQ